MPESEAVFTFGVWVSLMSAQSPKNINHYSRKIRYFTSTDATNVSAAKLKGKGASLSHWYTWCRASAVVFAHKAEHRQVQGLSRQKDTHGGTNHRCTDGSFLVQAYGNRERGGVAAIAPGVGGNHC